MIRSHTLFVISRMHAGGAATHDVVLKVCVEWGFFGRRGEGRDMNHSSRIAGNKVHFLSRQTISQPLRDDVAGPPDINLHGGNLLLPRGGEGREGSAWI